MKKIFTTLSLLSSLILVGCGNNEVENPPIDDPSGDVEEDPPVDNPDDNPPEVEDPEEPPVETPIGENDAIIVYFSATGNTERVANVISDYIESPAYLLEPVNPYSSADLNYNNDESRVVEEHNDPNRVVELVNTTFEGFDEAEYVFLGFPVWWQEPSWVIDEFLRNNDFTDKNIIPFGTSSSSRYSTDSKIDLAPGANWIGEQRFSSRVSDDDVIAWIDSLNIDFNS